jgi:hypothetical protein
MYYDRTLYWLYRFSLDTVAIQTVVFPLYSCYLALGSSIGITDLIGIVTVEQFDLRHRSIKLTAPQTGTFLGGVQLCVGWTHSGYCTVIERKCIYGPCWGPLKKYGRPCSCTAFSHPVPPSIDIHPSSSRLDCRHQLEGAKAPHH